MYEIFYSHLFDFISPTIAKHSFLFSGVAPIGLGRAMARPLIRQVGPCSTIRTIFYLVLLAVFENALLVN